jgi:hypothetical protein
LKSLLPMFGYLVALRGGNSRFSSFKLTVGSYRGPQSGIGLVPLNAILADQKPGHLLRIVRRRI